MNLRGLSKLVLVTVFLSSTALAGSGGKNSYEDRVYFDDLRKVEEPAYAPAVQPQVTTPINTTPSPVPSSVIQEQQTSSDSLSYFANKAKQKKLKPRVELNHRYSNDRAITTSEFWVPLIQDTQGDSVLFGDVRLVGDTGSNQEFNAGLGYREIVTGPILGEGIAGATLWYDRRFTNRGSRFNQITASGEWLGEQYDVRVNGYIPFNDSKTHTQANTNTTPSGFVGNQIFVNTDQSVVEEALPGVDVEVGTRINALDKLTDSTRIYAGGYHFEGDRTDDVTGVRARIASDITSDIQLGARYQYDDVRDSQAFVEATIRFPFKSKKSFKQDGLRSRLDESPERDIDIVTNEAVTDDGVDQLILNARTGVTQNVVHVDNTAAGGGDGSIETPFNTLAGAEAVAVANDLIYVHRGDGTTTGQDTGITIDDEGQMLAGSGVDLLFSSGRFTTGNNQDVSNDIIVQTATTAPVITNGAGDGVLVTADDVLVTGITVDGASLNGIHALNADNIVVDTVTTNNNTSNGLGIVINSSSLNTVTLTSNNINNNTNGITLLIENSGVAKNININRNNVINNIQDGVRIAARDTGSRIDSLILEGNVAENNADDGGFIFTTQSASVINNVILKNNISINHSIGDGFRIQSSDAGSSFNNVIYEGNIADGNNNIGFQSVSFADGNIGKVTYTNNTSTNNSLDGIRLFSVSNGNIDTVIFNENIISNNVQSGIVIDDDSAVGSINIDLGGGVLGSIANNSIFNNTLEEIRIDLDGGELSAENNFFGTAAGLLPAEVLLQDGSTIDADPFLTSDPNL